MTRIGICCVLAVLLLSESAPLFSQGFAQTAEEEPAKQTFLVIYRPGPAYDPSKPVREQALGGHGKYLLNLYKSGDMKFAGPFTDNWGGGVVLSVANIEAAEEIAKNDPAVLSGVFVWEIHPWHLVPWENYVK